MSPNYPNKYNANTNKKFKVWVETGKKIELTVKEFELEASSYSSCSYDFIYINDRDDGILMSEKCGKMLIKDSQILSTSNCIRIQFTSDVQTQEKGFKFEWRQVEVDGKQNLNHEYIFNFNFVSSSIFSCPRKIC